VLVSDADAVAAKAKAAGGNVIAEPFDVLNAGRMAILADPSGAVFGLWQPKEHTGWEVNGVPGSVCWVELDSRNIDAARRFYTDVFGWTAKDSPGPIAYTEFQLDGPSFAGGMAMPEMVPTDLPSFWQTYFAVTDADGVAARAKELGGSVVMEPQDIPDIGRYAILHDPQGAFFGILQPAPQAA
jgi:predicted enzyme related to lactoylglutathione lyase